MNKICIPFVPDYLADVFEFYKKVRPLKPDLIEISLNNLEMYEIPAIFADNPCPIIVVCKGEAEKWSFRGSEADRVYKLITATEAWADYTDIGINSDDEHISNLKEITYKKRSKLIISSHNWDKTPKLSTMLTWINRMLKFEPDIIKYITSAEKVTDNIQIYRLCDKLKTRWIKYIAFAMWAFGRQSRIICPTFWSLWSYCPYDIALSTGPWQIDINTIREIWNKI